MRHGADQESDGGADAALEAPLDLSATQQLTGDRAHDGTQALPPYFLAPSTPATWLSRYPAAASPASSASRPTPIVVKSVANA